MKRFLTMTIIYMTKLVTNFEIDHDELIRIVTRFRKKNVKFKEKKQTQ